MSDLHNKINLAKRELGRTVVKTNPTISKEIIGKNYDAMYFGVKDTRQIPEAMVEKLRSDNRFAWLTIDKSSNRGRAIDTDLINPVTYRVMTGSTSGGPINIVKGINDFAIGTDGGGSVLAPALSCQLPSMIGAGLDLFVKNKKRSTEGLEFTGSIGVISKNVHTLKTVMECLTNENLTITTNKRIKVLIPKKNSVVCPDGVDMQQKVLTYLSRIEESPYIIEEVDMGGIEDRKRGINVIREAFKRKDVDLIVTCEGPVDVYGYGETIPQFLGKAGLDITKNHGKFLVRAANMCQTTAITVPIETIASGLVIIAKKGITSAGYALELAERLEKSIQMPEVWKRYFTSESNFSGLEFY
ncbi:amidase family protein [Neobacillus novalis]|uniref:Amidase family protein n=1 Tax=Neobacillus novalis TaxID=220687 RepID=A0AA95MKX3_9BACI|nr:amidase family protein [Neobacillus novalis]WHY85834.1 amidase family protein [Neobacillus novalis]